MTTSDVLDILDSFVNKVLLYQRSPRPKGGTELHGHREHERELVNFWISPNQSLEEQRLTLIHEVVHYFFDYYQFPNMGRWERLRERELEVGRKGPRRKSFRLCLRVNAFIEDQVEQEAISFCSREKDFVDVLFAAIVETGHES